MASNRMVIGEAGIKHGTTGSQGEHFIHYIMMAAVRLHSYKDTFNPDTTEIFQKAQLKINNKKNDHKIVNIILPICFNICFGCSKELSH